MEVHYGWYESPDSDNPSESDIFVREPLYPRSSSWDFESKQWITIGQEPAKDPSIKIEQSAFINLAQEYMQIKEKGFVIELIQHDNGTFSLFYLQ